mmetsp:Transcript_23285/g.63094  ORF Transcript_23285/g.63094 Transcript_23285/m.63094 type:complete len:241 (+) Transcript_23285:424-1146(+)
MPGRRLRSPLGRGLGLWFCEWLWRPLALPLAACVVCARGLLRAVSVTTPCAGAAPRPGPAPGSLASGGGGEGKRWRRPHPPSSGSRCGGGPVRQRRLRPVRAVVLASRSPASAILAGPREMPPGRVPVPVGGGAGRGAWPPPGGRALGRTRAVPVVGGERHVQSPALAVPERRSVGTQPQQGSTPCHLGVGGTCGSWGATLSGVHNSAPEKIGVHCDKPEPGPPRRGETLAGPPRQALVH